MPLAATKASNAIGDNGKTVKSTLKGVANFQEYCLELTTNANIIESHDRTDKYHSDIMRITSINLPIPAPKLSFIALHL